MPRLQCRERSREQFQILLNAMQKESLKAEMPTGVHLCSTSVLPPPRGKKAIFTDMRSCSQNIGWVEKAGYGAVFST
jgi:hypothetical protein